jgi:hypothetical protein
MTAQCHETYTGTPNRYRLSLGSSHLESPGPSVAAGDWDGPRLPRSTWSLVVLSSTLALGHTASTGRSSTGLRCRTARKLPPNRGVDEGFMGLAAQLDGRSGYSAPIADFMPSNDRIS